jgi:hypothetical protein
MKPPRYGLVRGDDEEEALFDVGKVDEGEHLLTF